MKNIIAYAFASMFFLMITACSSIEQHLITEDSATSKEKTLVVMGIKWVETYNDPEEKTIETLTSYQLLDNEELVKDRLIQAGKPELRRELYYLSHFVFHFNDEIGKTNTIEYFAKDLRTYDPIAIYQFQPGKLTLDNISVKLKKYKNHREVAKTEFWKPYNVYYPQDYGSWSLPKGRVVYLGDLTLYFKTKRFVYGLIYREVINQAVTLMKVTMEDRFEETKASLKEKKPWFPADQIENISFAKEWVFNQEPLDEVTKPDSTGDTTEEQQKKKTEDSFF
ncbi:hypothetical protein KJ966_14350 [bacterium]|nr:hypothetical protein [bacterium]